MTLTAAQLEMRKCMIGASQVPAVLGEGLFGSELTVWTEVMALPREDISDRNEVKAGNYFQSGVLAWWLDDFGKSRGLTLRRMPEETIVHPRLSWLCATPDDYALDAAGNVVATVQAKTGGWYRELEWEDPDTHEVAVPLAVVLQVQTEMEVTGLDLSYVAAVIGGNRPYWGVVERDREMWASMEKLLAAWHKRHVLGGVQPDPTGRAWDTRALRKLSPSDNGQTIRLSVEGVGHARKSEELQEQIAELELERERLRNLLRAEMGAATFAEGPGVRVSNKTNKKGVRTLLVG